MANIMYLLVFRYVHKIAKSITKFFVPVHMEQLNPTLMDFLKKKKFFNIFQKNLIFNKIKQG